MNYMDIWMLGVLLNFIVPTITSLIVIILLIESNGAPEYFIQSEKLIVYLKNAGLPRHIKSFLFTFLPFVGIVSAMWMCITLIKCKFNSEKYMEAIIKLDKKMYQNKEL